MLTYPYGVNTSGEIWEYGVALNSTAMPNLYATTAAMWLPSAGMYYRPRQEPAMQKCEYCGRPHAIGKETCSGCGAPLY